jgi:tRNA threonylcarbamoyladenosine biosynthesis protein TsaB
MTRKTMVQKPLILAVETSGRAGSAAIARGPQLIDNLDFSAPMRHSAELFVAVDQLLKKADLKPRDIEHIYISSGPGSFTGIRIAVTMAKTMNFANGAKIVALDTLDVIAQNAADYIRDKNATVSRIATILDAKRGQFFVAVYDNQNGKWVKTTPDCLMTAAEFVRNFSGFGPIWLLGEGLVYYANMFAGEGINFLDKEYWPASAKKVHKLGWQEACQNRIADSLKLVPFYLRGPDAVPKQKL